MTLQSQIINTDLHNTLKASSSRSLSINFLRRLSITLINGLSTAIPSPSTRYGRKQIIVCVQCGDVSNVVCSKTQKKRLSSFHCAFTNRSPHFTSKMRSERSSLTMLTCVSQLQKNSSSKERIKQAALLTQRHNRLAHYFALFWGWGLLLGYLATSGAKSDVIFLLGDPDFQYFARFSRSDAGQTDNR